MKRRNKKKALLALALALCLCLGGCQRQFTPKPEVEAFLNGNINAPAAFEAIEKASYTSTVSQQNGDGEVLGTAEYRTELDKSDPERLYLRMEQRFTGVRVENGVETLTATLQSDGAGGYDYVIVENGVEKRESMDATTALDLVSSVVYRDNGAYDEGGLYYGDFFMMNIYRYPAESFTVDTERDLCVFDDRMSIDRKDVGKVYVYQTTSVDRLGLMHYNYERYESPEKDFVLVSETVPEYVLK